MENKEQPRIDVRWTDEADPDAAYSAWFTVDELLKRSPFLAGIVDHPDFVRMEIVVGLERTVFSRCDW